VLPKEGTTLFQTGYLNLRFLFHIIVDSFLSLCILGSPLPFSICHLLSADSRLFHTHFCTPPDSSVTPAVKNVSALTVVLQLSSHQLLRIVTLSNSYPFSGLDEIRSLLAQYCCKPSSPCAHSITGLIFCRRASMRNASQ
jgi:hypothetical protein